MTISEIISAIVSYETLPSQIDYTKKYKIEAEMAWDELQKRPTYDIKYVERIVSRRVNAYYEPLLCLLQRRGQGERHKRCRHQEIAHHE